MTADLHAPGLLLPDQAAVRWTSFTKAIRLPEQSWPAQICERPMFVGRIGERSMALIADPEAARTVLAGSEALFPKWKIYSRVVGRGAGRQNISATSGDACQRQRRELGPIFASSRMPALQPGFRAAAERAAETWEEHGGTVRIDACLEMTRITLDTIWRTLFEADAALPCERFVDHAARLIDAAQARYDINAPAKHIDALARSSMPLAEGLAGSPFARLAADAPEAADLLGRDELYHNLLLLLGAGHETTALTLTWALLLIGRDHKVQDLLQAELRQVVGSGPVELAHVAELTLLRHVVSETLRLYAPTPVVVRQASQAVELAGERLEAGSVLAVCIYALHRHRLWWSEPDLFRPRRFAAGSDEPRHRDAFLPFGAGRHVCIGSHFGWTEAITVLATLLIRFRVVAESGEEIRPRLAITIRPDRPVMIDLHPRSGRQPGRPAVRPTRTVDTHPAGARSC